MKYQRTQHQDPYRANMTMHLIEEKARLTYVMNSWILAVQRQARRNIRAQCRALLEGDEGNAQR